MITDLEYDPAEAVPGGESCCGSVTSFSLLSDAGVPIEDVSRLVGHSSTSVTELVCRHHIWSVIQSVRRSWIGSSIRRATVELPQGCRRPQWGRESSKAQVSAIASRKR